MKVTIECTEKELKLINNALDFYSRVGVGQFSEIINHPTFQKNLYENCIPKKDPEVGDRTPQGEIVEIKDGKALISGSIYKETGHWHNVQEWKDLNDVKLSTDYNEFHKLISFAEESLYHARNILYGDNTMGKNGNWGIYHPNVDDSCKIAYHLHQVIRHELWKQQENPTLYTVDSYPADACTIAGMTIPTFDVKIDVNIKK